MSPNEKHSPRVYGAWNIACGSTEERGNLRQVLDWSPRGTLALILKGEEVRGGEDVQAGGDLRVQLAREA